MAFKYIYNQCSEWLALLIQSSKVKFPKYDDLKNNCDPAYVSSVEILVTEFNSSHKNEMETITSHLCELKDNSSLEIREFLNMHLNNDASIFLRDSMELAIKIYLTYEPVIKVLNLGPIISDTCDLAE